MTGISCMNAWGCNTQVTRYNDDLCPLQYLHLPIQLWNNLDYYIPAIVKLNSKNLDILCDIPRPWNITLRYYTITWSNRMKTLWRQWNDFFFVNKNKILDNWRQIRTSFNWLSRTGTGKSRSFTNLLSRIHLLHLQTWQTDSVRWARKKYETY